MLDVLCWDEGVAHVACECALVVDDGAVLADKAHGCFFVVVGFYDFGRVPDAVFAAFIVFPMGFSLWAGVGAYVAIVNKPCVCCCVADGLDLGGCPHGGKQGVIACAN